MSGKQIKILVAFVALLGGGYLLTLFFGGSAPAVPQDFTSARLAGALISQNIVNLSSQSVGDLLKVNELENNRDYVDALNTTTELIEKSSDIRNQAVDLSGQVEKMTRSLSGIQSFEARQAALEAISNQLALISRLINYSGYLGQLLDALRGRFTGQSASDAQVQSLINEINAEVRAINNFNNQATQAMARFDKVVGQ